ncbi:MULTISPECIES: hypothetical protein [Streptomyces]|uniref:Uncharacterized protein n=1 Tax=Streptomyces griseocarneus TaxID=51201 RepID=A0ABX7RUI6_9ACTN|nr:MULTISPECIES: hypothetical protein [Streptomyces]QSY51472.1 hypothetical protein J3S04_11715 [Streptomyces griseocarneus]
MPNPQPADADVIRQTAARVAVELRDALRAHGHSVQVVPEPPSYGQPYVTFLSPLREDEARLITAALAAYSGARESGQPCGECRSIKQEWATAQRGGDREGAAALAWSMGLHQRRAHT